MTDPQIPGLSRREALIAFGAVGFGAAYREAGARAIMSLRRRGRRVSSGYRGTMAIGVNPS